MAAERTPAPVGQRAVRRRRVRRGGTAFGVALLGWALLHEARLPAGERHRTGRLAGFIPYDLRRPTLAKVRERLWAPADPRIIMPRVFGVGWTLNLGRVFRLARARLGCRERADGAP